MKKILLVEDDVSIAQNLQDFLEHSDLEVVKEFSGQTALWSFDNHKPDLVVLDWNLPGKSGLQICQEIRKKSDVPIIMLTARREEVDQVQGLESGAHDYLTKPFSPKVLILKIKKLLSIPRNDNKELLRYKDLELNTQNHRCSRLVQDSSGGWSRQNVSLTPVEFNLVKTLFSMPKQAFSRDQLLDHIYDESIPPDVFDRTVDSHVKNIRKKLGQDSYIETLRGVGYQAAEE